MCIGDRFKSLNNSFSSQELALGYRVISLGPIHHIKRVIEMIICTRFSSWRTKNIAETSSSYAMFSDKM